MIDNRTVGKTIAALRQARGMTQQQLAAAMNVSHQAVSKWENGAALPDIQTLMELTQLFGITVEQLLSGEIPEPRLESDSGVSLKNIGQFIDGMINDIGNVFKSDRKMRRRPSTVRWTRRLSARMPAKSRPPSRRRRAARMRPKRMASIWPNCFRWRRS